ncbi:PREDICTED: protein-glutamine gamma-glutamyltransferase E-like isoform X2 [Gavialis gangeticus]|uniref:protein-glutamine gamma-glutamyltransferase E-like isoform X2 n=1 Tax=Gavialis gangeticus TaxID=94835 RepID=UPI00092F3058|nr:PREDICTED: protein-glutamine gamma-glutamyltransferase E-like isoform X2 [Gavialis gangeticus]
MAALTLREINWQRNENGSAHHTDKYPGKELVARRGQAFTIVLTFSGEWKTGQGLTFIARTGPRPSSQAKTQAEFDISKTASKDTWSAVLQSTGSGSASISISSPVTAPIGRYRLSVKVSLGGRSSTLNIGTFVLLFNPWSKEDEVFMPDAAERNEYVLEEFGVLFVGSASSIYSFGWNYGQFQKDILDICLSILDRSLEYRRDAATDVSRRNDPKYVGRVLTAMVNSLDDNGVLMGNWSGDYSGGKSPNSWSGSVAILLNWKESGYKPVKFGQCWVFAAVLATVLRCLGIPSRAISNFDSAHDADENLTVDEYYDSAGNPLKRGIDSVWNFHVWNEGWFTRSDLGSSYGGWQVLDATPQETSEGIYQCGPASVTAIKEGDVDLRYEAPFIFAEVNADRIAWSYDSRTGKKKPLHTDTKSIGRFISTKAVGSYARVDVTNNYKYEEGSQKEREIFKKAHEKMVPDAELRGTSARLLEIIPKPDISGKFKVDSPLEVGKDVNLILILSNLTSVARNVKANITAWAIVYTRKPIREIWKDTLSVTLAANEEKQLPIKITYAEYQQRLTTDNMIQITALCQVQSGTEVLVQRELTVTNPPIDMKVLGEAKVNEAVDVEVMFTNPINEEVKDCMLRAEGNDLLKGSLKINVPSLKPNERSAVQFEIIPTKGGTKQLLINFSCDKFSDIKAFETINVAK